MLEMLRCPSCSTRFGIGPSRVHAGIRRAQCFSCDAVFGIEEVVARLLAPLQEDPAPVLPPSLTLGDLEETDEDLLEKTLITFPPPPEAPDAPAEAEEEPSPYTTGGPGFSSARDAIAKLMGQQPPTAPATAPRPFSARGTVDVEAALDALQTSLGGSAAPQDLEPPPKRPDTASTVRLSAAEVRAALGPAPTQPSAPLPATQPMAVQPDLRPLPAAPPPSMEPSQDANLLKVQLEHETCNNVTIEQMTAWIGEGRVQEYHMVARQFSEHWIEASKVPSLRPIFDQKRRLQGLPEARPVPPTEIQPPKRGLFGGFFSRG